METIQALLIWKNLRRYATLCDASRSYDMLSGLAINYCITSSLLEGTSASVRKKPVWYPTATVKKT